MNVVGRQMPRSGAATRQYSDNDDSNFIEVPSKWLQSAANLPQV